MLRWRRVLVATDFSPSADAALRSAVALVGQAGGSLVVVHALESPPPAYLLGLSSIDSQDISEQWAPEARAALKRTVDRARRDGLRARGVFRIGRPWQEILEVAQEESADAICIGNSGHSAFERILIGSTAENVVRRTEIPVLVTRDEPLTVVRRILAPVNFDPGSRAALQFACDGFSRHTKIDALHIATPFAPTDPMLAPIVLDEDAIREELNRFLRRSKASRASGEVRVCTSAAAGILREATERDVDLIVIATHGRRGLARAFLGSVAEKVARHADRPVLVLPGPGRWRATAARGKATRARPRTTSAQRRPRSGAATSTPPGRGRRGPWTAQAHTGRSGPPGRRGAGSSSGKRHGGRRPGDRGKRKRGSP